MNINLTPIVIAIMLQSLIVSTERIFFFKQGEKQCLLISNYTRKCSTTNQQLAFVQYFQEANFIIANKNADHFKSLFGEVFINGGYMGGFESLLGSTSVQECKRQCLKNPVCIGYRSYQVGNLFTYNWKCEIINNVENSGTTTLDKRNDQLYMLSCCQDYNNFSTESTPTEELKQDLKDKSKEESKEDSNKVVVMKQKRDMVLFLIVGTLCMSLLIGIILGIAICCTFCHKREKPKDEEDNNEDVKRKQTIALINNYKNDIG